MKKIRYTARAESSSLTKRRKGPAIVVAVALGLGTIAAAAPAVAANHCDSGWVCLYDYDNYTSLIGERHEGESTRLAVPLADATAAWGNDGIYDAALWDEPSSSSACWELPTKSSGSFGIGDRDRQEYWRTVNGC